MFRNLLAKRRSALAAFLLASVVLAGGCAPARALEPAFAGDPDAVTVVAAESVYGDVVHQIGGPHVRVYSLLTDPDADPHLYESSPADARVVAGAALVIRNGGGYDAFMDRLLAASPAAGRTLLDVAELAGAPAGSNPHLWYDPATMPRLAASAARALARIDPAHSSEIAANLAAFTASLAPIEGRIAALRDAHRGTPVAATEPVYSRMLEALGLAVLSPTAFMKAVEDGVDPPSASVAAMQDLLRRHRVRLLVYNAQAVTRTTAAIGDLAAASGVPVVPVTETEPEGMTFQAWQLAELDAVAAALAAP